MRCRAETLIHPIRAACSRCEKGGFPELWPIGPTAPSSRERLVSERLWRGKANLTPRWILPGRCGYLATSDPAACETKEPAITSRSASGTSEPFAPRFDGSGLLTAVAVDAQSGAVLMLAHMDAEALAKTRETGFAHFHSRSRGRLWKKGETSGHTLRVVEIHVDCDQDALVLRVEPAGPACHTGAQSCFFRVLEGDRLSPNVD